jgi:hypothetical protein
VEGRESGWVAEEEVRFEKWKGAALMVRLAGTWLRCDWCRPSSEWRSVEMG